MTTTARQAKCGAASRDNKRREARGRAGGGGGTFAGLRRRLGIGGPGAGGHAEQEAALSPGQQPGLEAQEAALAPTAPGAGATTTPRHGSETAPAEVDREQVGPGDGAGQGSGAGAGQDTEVAPGGGPTYLSQRDNESRYSSGDVQCSPTSFAMQLVNVYGGDVEAVKTRARAILSERGIHVDYTQVEDLLIEILQTTDWKKATADKPDFFWSPKTWASWAAKAYNGVYYKDPNAQQYVASLFDEVGNSGAETYSGLYTYAAWAPIISALEQGASVTAQGAFTSSGHVVSVVSADADGVVINDPYGLYVEGGYYLRNGEAPRSSLGTQGLEVLKRRAKLRSDVVPAYEATQAMSNWGERNWYSWAEVEQLQIGKWLSVIKGK